MYTRPRPEERTLYVGIIAILRITGMVCIGAANVEGKDLNLSNVEDNGRSEVERLSAHSEGALTLL
ncbi:hypothetical protein C5167_007943 [Papaver somniferum]|uniref:Uncharacterized protein n=1 Tax=Papaver somniferum TaxID=3469 RepID=A0A4Y7JX00_PAPSO|nr:hypothetical protein C5167_007943 [Papaver somniferum]